MDKEVILLTPVIIGNTNLPRTFQKQKVTYSSIGRLNNQRIPRNINQLDGGVLIRMPANNVRKYLSTVVNLNNLKNDYLLVQYLR